MKITPINSNITLLKPKSFLNTFSGNSNATDLNSKQNDDDKYVKVPKAQHKLEKWIVGIFGVVTAFEIIDFVLNKKWNSWKI